MAAALPDNSIAHRYLHCNLNVVDVDVAGAFYSAVVGITETMRSGDRDTETDGAVLSVPGMTRSTAAFFYDSRGPRTACANEIVAWYQPATVGVPYEDPWAVGLQALGYAVDDPAATAALARANGGKDATGPDVSDVVGGPTVTVLDPSGSGVDLVQDAAEAGTIRHLRQNVRNLDASVEWYQAIGFSVVREPADGVLGGTPVRHATLKLSDEKQRLVLVQVPSSAPQQPYTEPYHAGLFRSALQVDDPVAAHERLIAEGRSAGAELHELELGGTNVGHLQILVLRDPDGVLVEMVGRDRSIFR
ncbi:MAG TPA: VOC family protein [Mycobacteriales bacterium]|jgi:catechol 2,3-dioxygenase-like lactoylglutathione lyase family enzyme|nr:VOC family protein [Mycobacteriales bacterium]